MPSPQNAGFQTKNAIRDALTAAGTHPKRRFGQNFLIDQNLMGKLIEAADIGPDDVILEVGTGTGSLTTLLARSAPRVETFEIDPDVAEIAQARLAEFPHVRLTRGDALQNQTTLAPKLRRVLDASPGRVKLVANLPYDIATPLLMALLIADAPPISMCFTIQREVGLRLTAAHNTRDYGPASILAQICCAIERVARVPAAAFWPRPKIESVMLKMSPRADAPAAADRRRLSALVRAAFLHRRKTMRQALKDASPAAELISAFESLGIPPTGRPESLTPNMWMSLSDSL
jgi:16S rRNA (adenine1518-N6/adenine1519-N6)-dimethyltransferase